MSKANRQINYSGTKRCLDGLVHRIFVVMIIDYRATEYRAVQLDIILADLSPPDPLSPLRMRFQHCVSSSKPPPAVVDPSSSPS